MKSRSKIALFSNERHFEIWFSKKKTITFFWSKLFKLHKKDPILHVATSFSLKQGETRTSHGPIPHPLKLTLTWQFCLSWATDFFRVTSSSASDFRFCGRQVTSEEGHKHDFKSRPPHHGSWRWFLFSWSKWIHVCIGHLHHSPFERLLHHPNWWRDYFEVHGLMAALLCSPTDCFLVCQVKFLFLLTSLSASFLCSFRRVVNFHPISPM